MSFAGHVFDMIRRDKENRQLKELRRERRKESRDKLSAGRLTVNNNMSYEEYMEIDRQLKEEELLTRGYRYRCALIISGILIFLVILILLVIRYLL